MTRETYDIGPVPNEEVGEQLGENFNAGRARFETEVYIRQLKREFGEPPEGARLRIGSNAHEYGTYLEARYVYDPKIKEHWDYFEKIESGCDKWDRGSRIELHLPLFKHDCPACEYQGHFNGHDVYFCGETHVARCSDVPHEYYSTRFFKEEDDPASKAIAEAKAAKKPVPLLSIGKVLEHKVRGPRSKFEDLLETQGMSQEEFIDVYMLDSVVPGICMNLECNYTCDVEPDQHKGHCENCGTKTVKSGIMLLGII